MLRKTNRISTILSKAGSIALGVALAFTACTNEQGEAHRVIGTGDEGENYEMNEGHDSTVSGSAVTSALKADTAAEEDALIENNVADKMDTSESYSSINGRTSTSNKGASVSNGGGTTTGSIYSGQQQNQTPAPGSNQTTTNQTVPVKPTNRTQGGANQVQRSQTGAEDPNGRPIRNGKAAPANESKNRQ